MHNIDMDTNTDTERDTVRSNTHRDILFALERQGSMRKILPNYNDSDLTALLNYPLNHIGVYEFMLEQMVWRP